jgi:hypothetical protein
MEFIPGIFWIDGFVCPDFIKANNVKIVIGQDPIENPNYMVVKVSREDITRVVQVVFTFYRKNVNCVLNFDEMYFMKIFTPNFMKNVCKIDDPDEISELVRLNYSTQ